MKTLLILPALIFVLSASASSFVEKSLFGNPIKIPPFRQYEDICESNFDIWNHINKIYGSPGQIHLLTCFSDINFNDPESDGVGGIAMAFFDNRYKDGDVSTSQFKEVKSMFSSELQKIITIAREQVNPNSNVKLRTGNSMSNISGSDDIESKIIQDNNNSYLWVIDMNLSYELDGVLIKERSLKVIGYVLIDGWPIKVYTVFTGFPLGQREALENQVKAWVDRLLLENES